MIKHNTEVKASGTLQLTNRYVHALQQLLDRPMHGQKSKMRNAFVKLTKPYIDDYENDRRKINLKHAKKDPKTKQPIKSTEGKGVYEYEDDTALEKDWEKIGMMPVLIDVNKHTKPFIIFLRDYLEETRSKFVETCIPKRVVTADDIKAGGDFEGKMVGATIRMRDENGEFTPAFTYDQQEYVDLLDDLLTRIKDALSEV